MQAATQPGSSLLRMQRYFEDQCKARSTDCATVCCLQRSSAAQPSLLQKLPGGVSVAAPKQNVAAGQAAVFAGLGGWALIQVRTRAALSSAWFAGWRCSRVGVGEPSSTLHHCL
jgi:hypothetical protein